MPTRLPYSGPSRNWRKSSRSWALSYFRQFRDVSKEAIAREYPLEQGFWSRFLHPAREYPRNATSDSKVSENITKTKTVRRLAAICSSFASTAFQCFLPDWRFSEGTPWRIAENRTLKRGSSPPRVEIQVCKWLLLKNLRSMVLGQMQNLVPDGLMSD